MNVIDVAGHQIALGEDGNWQHHGGRAIPGLTGTADAISRNVETGPSSMPTPGGHIAMVVASHLGGKVVQLDDNPSHSNPNVVY